MVVGVLASSLVMRPLRLLVPLGFLVQDALLLPLHDAEDDGDDYDNNGNHPDHEVEEVVRGVSPSHDVAVVVLAVLGLAF